MTLATIAWVVTAPVGTWAVFVLARRLYRRAPSPLTLPVVITSVVVIAILLSARLDVARYEEASRPISFWLGPATVALAIPLHRERARLRKHARAIVVGTASGALVSVVFVVVAAIAFRLPRTLVSSLAPKSVTTPIAMPIAERIGGIPSITAAVVVVTGVIGMAFGPALLDRIGVRDRIARGVAMGTAAHGIGTARAIEEHATTGAISGVAMIVSGVVTALVAPLVLAIAGGLIR